jgi:hypothetical protein
MPRGEGGGSPDRVTPGASGPPKRTRLSARAATPRQRITRCLEPQARPTRTGLRQRLCRGLSGSRRAERAWRWPASRERRRRSAAGVSSCRVRLRGQDGTRGSFPHPQMGSVNGFTKTSQGSDARVAVPCPGETTRTRGYEELVETDVGTTWSMVLRQQRARHRWPGAAPAPPCGSDAGVGGAACCA